LRHASTFQHRRATRSAHSTFRTHTLIVERAPFPETLESIRLKLLRDETKDVVRLMGAHTEALDIARELLKDGNVGVGTLAADAFREAVLSGVDISRAVPDLREALGDKYAKKNAAHALALFHVRRGDVSSLESLLSHKDKEIRAVAGDACVDGCDRGRPA